MEKWLQSRKFPYLSLRDGILNHPPLLFESRNGFRFSHWFSFRSGFLKIPTLPTVPRGPGDWPRFLGAIIPCTDDNRISQREPLTSACDQLVLNQEYGNDSDDVITIFIIKLRLTMARQWDSSVRRGPQASFLTPNYYWIRIGWFLNVVRRF